MDIGISFFAEGALFWEAWDEIMNPRLNEPNKMKEVNMWYTRTERTVTKFKSVVLFVSSQPHLQVGDISKYFGPPYIAIEVKEAAIFAQRNSQNFAHASGLSRQTVSK